MNGRLLLPYHSDTEERNYQAGLQLLYTLAARLLVFPTASTHHDLDYPIPSMIFPVASQRSQGSSVGLPVFLSACLPVPWHSGQTSSPVPGVPASGSSSGVWRLNGFFDCIVRIPFCIEGLGGGKVTLPGKLWRGSTMSHPNSHAFCQGRYEQALSRHSALIPTP